MPVASAEPASLATSLTQLPASVQWLNHEFAYHQLWQWLALPAGLLFVFAFARLLRLSWRAVLRLAKVKRSLWADKLVGIVKDQVIAILALLAGYLYILSIGYTETLTTVVGYGIRILIAIHIFRLLYRMVEIAPEVASEFGGAYIRGLDPAIIHLFTKLGKAIVVVILPLMVLQNLGVNVASLLAGLGLAGLAFSLAAKDSAANFFASIMIIIDKPFDLGDWIIVDGHEGSIAEIGIRSTRIRTFYDSIITVPNSVLMNAHIDNMGQRNHRRIKTTIELSYDTTPERMRLFLAKVREILSSHSRTVKDLDQHVVLSEFRESSFGVLLYFFIDVKDWTEELLVREEIFLAVVDAASELEVKLAYPTRVVHFANSENAQVKGREALSGRP